MTESITPQTAASTRLLKLARTRPIVRARDAAAEGALRDAWRSRRLDLNEVDRLAKALRVDRVMRPYLEMLVV